MHGFTLIELVVVVIILGVLAAIALPRFIGLGANARIAALKAATGAISSAAEMAHMKCKLTAGCTDVLVSAPNVPGPGGQMNGMYYGYPTGVSRAGFVYGIRDWVQMDGFNIVEAGYMGKTITDFQLIGAPDPANCKITYFEHDPIFTTYVAATTSGC